MKKALVFSMWLALALSLIAFAVVVAQAGEPVMLKAKTMTVFKEGQFVGAKPVEWAILVKDSTVIVFSAPALTFTMRESERVDSLGVAEGFTGKWLCQDTDGTNCVLAMQVDQGHNLIWVVYQDYVFVFDVLKVVRLEGKRV